MRSSIRDGVEVGRALQLLQRDGGGRRHSLERPRDERSWQAAFGNVRSRPLGTSTARRARFADGVRCRDPDAVAAVYRAVAPALRGFLRRRISHGEVADDLVEQTFVALIEHGDRFRGDGRALRAWLFRTARNQLYDWAKRADRRSDHELAPEVAAAIRDPDGDPGGPAVERSLDPRLGAALGTLTPDQREVGELRLIAQLSIAQVAELTARSPGAVKLLQHRAVRRLAEQLEPAPVADR